MEWDRGNVTKCYEHVINGQDRVKPQPEVMVLANFLVNLQRSLHYRIRILC
jgi:hypothetical protein